MVGALVGYILLRRFRAEKEALPEQRVLIVEALTKMILVIGSGLHCVSEGIGVDKDLWSLPQRWV